MRHRSQKILRNIAFPGYLFASFHVLADSVNIPSEVFENLILTMREYIPIPSGEFEVWRRKYYKNIHYETENQKRMAVQTYGFLPKRYRDFIPDHGMLAMSIVDEAKSKSKKHLPGLFFLAETPMRRRYYNKLKTKEGGGKNHGKRTK